MASTDLEKLASLYAELKKQYITHAEGKKLAEFFLERVRALNAPVQKLSDRVDQALKDQEAGLKELRAKLRSLKDGKDGAKGEKGDPGLDGTDGRDGKDGKPGKDGSPDTPEQVLTKLRKAGISIKDIRGLEQRLKEIADRPSVIRTGGVFGGGRPVHVPMVDVFTGDGSTKEFYLSKAPRDLNTVKAWGSDFPHILVHGATNGFTIAGKLLTLNATVDAPTNSARLVVEYYK